MKSEIQKKIIHQGDVFLIPIDKIPDDAKLVRKNIVQHGEVTGHKHFLVDSLFYEKGGKSYLRSNGGEMSHEDHPSKMVPAMDYEVRIQQEYFPDGFRNVVD